MSKIVIKNSSFRYDINGLRAIAVLSVLIFHFVPNALAGGFAGVDVFFVISGYLMTSIIFKGLENNNFSFWQFMKNRAKRILPALAVVILLLLLFGYLTLGPDAYKILGKHARDSLLFISNITYEKEDGYFDLASTSKFLLHTWSLSVEWQFYIIYPLLLIVLRKFFTVSTLKLIVIGLLIASFICSVVISYNHPVSAYFRFYVRAWEMMVGGLAFLYPLRNARQSARWIIEITGLVLVILSFFLVNITTPWPGYMALIPVVGTYLCIWAYNKSTWLSIYPIQKLGLWSYSIYLVHWPLLVFSLLLEWELSFISYFFITIILSVALYYSIEKHRQYGWGLLAFYIIVLLMSIYVRETEGRERFEIPQVSRDSMKHGHQGWRPKEWRLFGTGQKYSNKGVDFVVYGDSFSAQYTSYFKDYSGTLATIYEGECLSTPNFYSYGDKCKNLYELLKSGMEENPSDTLVMMQSWAHILKGLKTRTTNQNTQYNINEFIEILKAELLEMKKALKVNNIILVGIQNGFIGQSPEECLSQKFVKDIYADYFVKSNCSDIAPRQYTNDVELFNDQLSALTASQDWLSFINPNEAICDIDECVQIENNLSLYSDKVHFSEIGAKRVGHYIFDGGLLPVRE